MTQDDTITVELHNRAAALSFYPKMRVGIGDRGSVWSRVWRWLMKRNWRVRDVDFRTLVLTLERCR